MTMLVVTFAYLLSLDALSLNPRRALWARLPYRTLKIQRVKGESRENMSCQETDFFKYSRTVQSLTFGPIRPVPGGPTGPGTP